MYRTVVFFRFVSQLRLQRAGRRRAGFAAQVAGRRRPGRDSRAARVGSRGAASIALVSRIRFQKLRRAQASDAVASGAKSKMHVQEI